MWNPLRRNARKKIARTTKLLTVEHLEDRVVLDATYHNLAAGDFTQNWTGTDAALTTDNWTNIPSIIGFRGDGLTNNTSTDPQTTLSPTPTGPINLIANSNSAATAGGIHEIANDVVALQGSGTADAPFLLLHMNTTGRESVTILYVLRELDSTTTNQRFALQYRVGESGDFISVSAGAVNNVFSAAGNQTESVTAVLPTEVNNQAQVQIRIITNDAPGSDAMVGIDDIVVTSQAAAGNSPPEITAPDTATTNEDTSFAFTGTGNTVSVNDPNAGDTLTVTLAATNGTLTATGAGVSGSGTANVTVTGTQAAVNTALGTLAFAPALNFNGAATVTVNATDGTASAPQKVVNVTVNAVNDAPTVTSPGNQTTNEDTPTGALSITVADVDNAVAGLTLSGSSSNPTLVPNGNITFGGSGASRTVTVTPAANQSGTATITLTVSDGTATGTATFDITVNAVNDVPVVVTTPANPTFTENGTGVAVFTGTTIDTVESGQNVDRITLTVVGATESASEILNIDGTDVNLNNGFGLTTAANGLTVAVTTSGSGVLVTLSKTGGISPTAAAAVIDGIRYRHTTDNPTAGSRVVTLTSVRDTGGAPDTATLTAASTVTVVPVNDAPVLVGANNLTSINEDPATNPGTLVIDLIADQANDFDGPAIGIAVTATASAGGTWQYALDGTTFVDFGSVSPAAARLLLADATTRVRFVPNANFNGTVSGLTFRAWDQSTGTAGGTADTSITGGASAFSTGVFTASITVNSVNDAPSGADKAVTISQNTTYTFTAADFGFTDVNDTPANTLVAVKIATLPAVGTLALGGTPVTANQFVPVADITAGNLTFTPVANASGTPYASFTFQVQDNGTTANGGVDLDPTARTLTVNVNAVNQAPSGADKTVTINEDATYTFAAADFGFSDPDGNALLAVKITTTPTAGTLALSGTPVTADQFIPVASLGSLTFTPAANANGTNYASFTFQVQDGGGTASGGVDLDPTPNTITFNVTAVNDAPTVAPPGAQTIAEDGATAALSITVGDVETAAGSLTLSASSNNPTLLPAGSIVLGGSGASRTVTITPAANQFGTATVTLTVSDGSLTGTATFTLTVTEVNDAPVATDDALSAVDEDSGPRVIPFAALLGNDSAGPNESGQALTISAVGSAVGGTVAISGTDVIFTPTANFNGPASFDYTVRDNGTTNGTPAPLTDVGSVSFTVTAVNDTPTLNALVNVSGTIGVPQTVNLGGISAGGGESQGLTITATSSNPAVVANPVSVSYASPDATGALSFTPVGAGTTTITVRVTDDNGTPGTAADDQFVERTFVVNVINLAPVNTFPAAVTTNEDTPFAFTGANAISTDDPDDTIGVITTVVSIPMGSGTLSSGAASGIALSFTGTEAEVNAALAALVYTPPADANVTTLDGTVTLRITTTDGADAPNAGEDFLSITVNAVNDAPSFVTGAVPAAVNEDSGPQTVAGFATGLSRGPADESAQTLTFVITGNSNPTLFSAGPAISPTGTLTYTPAPDANGTATIRYQLMDSGGTDFDGVDTSGELMFTITVTPVSDAPFGASGTRVTPEDVPLTLTAADFGFTDPADGDALAGVVVTSLPTKGALTLAGAPVAAGQFVPVADFPDLVFAPAPQANGAGYAALGFRVQDTGTTADGGANRAVAANTLTFDVTAVNDSPTLALTAAALTVDRPGSFARPGFALFAPGGGIDEAAQVPTFTVATDNPGLFAVAPAIGPGGVLTLTPAPGLSGTATVTVTASDGGAENASSPTRTFAVTVLAPAGAGSGGAVGGGLNAAVATGPGLIALGSAPGTPARAVVVDARTGAVVREVVPFGGFAGGVQVALADVTGDGVADLVAGTATGVAAVAVYDGATGALVSTFFPFGALPGGAQLATGDVNGDGRADVVLGLNGSVPLIVAFDGATGGVVRVFAGLSGSGGATRMAVGDFTGDGVADVATAAGPGGNGLVVIYDGRTGGVADAFFAVPGFGGDVSLAAGDIDGDGLSELVAGIQVGGTAVAGAFGRGGRLARVFAAPTGAGASPSAAQLALADVDGDGFADLLVSSPAGTGLSRTVALSGKTGDVIRATTNAQFLGGADLATG